MLLAKHYDAAGPTQWSAENTAPTLVFFSTTRLVGTLTFLGGPFDGETLRREYIGRFEVNEFVGEIDTIRYAVGGERHLKIDFDRPIQLHRFAEDFAATFENPFTLVGNRFANDLLGGPEDDLLSGGGGGDHLRGGRGADRLDGGTGSDRLVGGRGDDRLLGVRGADEMTDGAGADVFKFRAAHRMRDSVTDFRAGRDVIDLSGIDAQADLSGDQSFELIGEAAFSGRSGELRFADGRPKGDMDGDAGRTSSSKSRGSRR